MPPKQSPQKLNLPFLVIRRPQHLDLFIHAGRIYQRRQATWCKYSQRIAPPSAHCSTSPRQMMEWQNVLLIDHSRYEVPGELNKREIYM